MDEVTLHLVNGHPADIHFDGAKEGTPINAFLFLSNVPTDPPMGHVLAYGNSDAIGRMLFNFWKNSAVLDPEGAFVIEQVARDIIKAVDSERIHWPEGGPEGRA